MCPEACTQFCPDPDLSAVPPGYYKTGLVDLTKIKLLPKWRCWTGKVCVFPMGVCQLWLHSVWSFRGFSSFCSPISNIKIPIETIIKLPRHQRIPSGAGWACALGYRGTAQKICSMDAQLNSCDMGVAWDVGSTSININININWR